MNQRFFRGVENALATERLDAYRQDGVTAAVTLARYLWNMALCEALYSPLQFVEIALRNAIHDLLAKREGVTEWFYSSGCLLPWQREQVDAVRNRLLSEGKAPNPGRLVAELHFGFWTSFFNKHHARTGIGYALASEAFAHAPRAERDMKKLDCRLNRVRELCNRVFHHERVIHWKDLDDQHAGILLLIGWISPELRELALALDRYTAIRRDGLDPWLAKLRQHWPGQGVGNNGCERCQKRTAAIEDDWRAGEGDPGRPPAG